MKTRAECIQKYGSDYFIEKKIEEGKLFKVGKGIYSEKNMFQRLLIIKAMTYGFTTKNVC